MTKESKRILISLTVICMMFISLIVYISYFQVFKAETIKKNSYNKRLWINEDKTIRGSILDRNGNVLAYSEESGDKYVRHYNYGNLYSHVIGYSYREYGKTGLELKYNNTLLDISENQAINEIKNIVSDKSIGNDLVLTIDHELQQITRNALKGKKGSIIAMNPTSGEVYAMVSMPDFNLETLREDWKTISEDTNSPLLNRATQGLYPPGSTFKIISALAILSNGEIEKDYNCTGETVIDGYSISDYNSKGHGQISLNEAIVNSCNTYFAEKSILVGKQAIGEMAERVLINKDILFDLSTKTSSFPYNENIGKTEIAASAIGQGRVQVTPLNMILLASSIANKGEIVKPTLIKRVVSSNGKTKQEIKTNTIGERLDPIIVEKVKNSMIEVVAKGTGKSAAIKGVEVAGKTGTAENGSKKSHAWFIGFAPAENPQISVVVLLEEEGSTGGKSAAPIARDIMKYAIDNIK